MTTMEMTWATCRGEQVAHGGSTGRDRGDFGGGSFARLASDADPEQLRVGRTGTSTNRSGPCRGRGNPAELSGGTTRQRRDNLAVASALLVRSRLLKARRMPKQNWQLP